MSSKQNALMVLSALLLCSCASNGSGGGSEERMVFKNANEVPEPVKAIETIIDTGGCIKADEVFIYVSRNYEWDITLTGDRVARQQDVGNGEKETVAVGLPRAMFRNLDIRAYKKITFRKSAFDVVPFIHIRAKGQAIFIEKAGDGGQLKVHHADAIAIDDSKLRLIGTKGPPRVVGGAAPAGPAAADPAPGLRQP